MNRRLGALLALSLTLACTGPASNEEATLRIGSKKFTESVILGELTTQLLNDAGVPAEHRAELGGTRVLWSALLRGEIDAYPEYSGTLRQEILSQHPAETLTELRAELAEHGVRMSAPLGFDNSYVLGMKEALAEAKGIRTLSDLARHPELRLGLSNEFMDRADGFPGLATAYGLREHDARGMDHDLAYRALEADSIEVIDLYSTDAEIEYYGLRRLIDDRGFFPRYQAVLLYRSDLPVRQPKADEALARLAALVSAQDMVSMNARAKLERVPEARVAADFLGAQLGLESEVKEPGAWQRFFTHSTEHLFLVVLSLAAAILFAIPLGILAARCRRWSSLILGSVGVIQTIPALALLVFMIPLLGIGAAPAIVALFLYSLLPIVRNTYAGLNDIPLPITESAAALGLSSGQSLRLVELPLAARSILAGIKTSAVINVGTATLGALIGTGGYGQPILTGIRLDDVGLIMQGAVPAAGLALLCQGLFELLERRLVSPALRAS